MSRYHIAADARKDLDGIWEYIAGRSSPEIATTFLWKFYETFMTIATSPAAGVAVPDFHPPDTRMFPMGNYLIYYRRARTGILVARVLHGKRLQRRALSRKPAAGK